MSASTEVQNNETQVEDIPMHAVVRMKDDDGEALKEIADIASISSTGAGFYIQRECHPGTIVSLMLPLEPHLRCYDHDKEFYRVWGLVQHCHPLSGEENVGFHVGVAFIGKRAPQSYNEDHFQSYKICGMTEEGLWRITEARSKFKPRRHVRYWTPIDLYLALVDERRVSLTGEKTVTENVSKNGAAVFSEMDVNVGDRVKFICEKYDFSGLAVVCNRHEGSDGKRRLHLQFVENSFPVERLDLKKLSSVAEKVSG